jgi:hypothetical protein
VVSISDNDLMEVKLSDPDYRVFYKKKLRIGDKKESEVLLEDLERYGVKIIKNKNSARWRFKL